MYGQVQKHIPSMAFVHVNMFANSLCMQTRLLVCANAFGLVCESLSNMCALYIASGRYCIVLQCLFLTRSLTKPNAFARVQERV